jgi:Amt family ammonium transporter
MSRYLPLAVLTLFGILGFMVPAGNPGAAANAINSGDVAWVLAASGLVLLMTPGLAFFYGGMVTSRNVISTMFQSLIAMGLVSLIWISFGFSMAFGDTIGGFVGNPLTYFFLNGVGEAPHPNFGATIPFALFALFQMKFAIITPALITGAFAERIRFGAYLVFITLFTIFIYTPVAHWTWNPAGFLNKWGVLDFAGGTVVHMTAGWAALAGAMILGPRVRAGHGASVASIPYIVLGTGLLWFGWFGFNAGSSLAANGLAVHAFLNTNTAAAAAMLAWLAIDRIAGKKPSVVNACIAGIVGLVAITPAAGYVSLGASVLIGIIAAGTSNFAVSWKNRSNIDDTLDVFPCHGVGGMVGMLLTGVFAADKGLVTGSTTLFVRHLLALGIVSVYSFAGSWILYKITNTLIPLRVSKEEEIEGLDLSTHGEAHPLASFQGNAEFHGNA